MNTAKGLVSYFGGNKFGDKTLWSLRLDGDETWYNLGEWKPDIQKGQTIEFTYQDTGKKKYVTKGSIQVLVATSDPVVAPRIEGVSGLSKDDYWRNREERDVAKDERIHLLACRNSAIALVGHLVGREGLVVLPKTNPRAAIDGLVRDYTEKFYNEETVDYESGQKDPEASGSPTSGV